MARCAKAAPPAPSATGIPGARAGLVHRVGVDGEAVRRRGRRRTRRRSRASAGRRRRQGGVRTAARRGPLELRSAFGSNGSPATNGASSFAAHLGEQHRAPGAPGGEVHAGEVPAAHHVERVAGEAGLVEDPVRGGEQLARPPLEVLEAVGDLEPLVDAPAPVELEPLRRGVGALREPGARGARLRDLEAEARADDEAERVAVRDAEVRAQLGARGELGDGEDGVPGVRRRVARRARPGGGEPLEPAGEREGVGRGLVARARRERQRARERRDRGRDTTSHSAEPPSAHARRDLHPPSLLVNGSRRRRRATCVSVFQRFSSRPCGGAVTSLRRSGSRAGGRGRRRSA